ncbi:Cu/Ag efflux protein CusF [Variovorax boronicumulans]|nr:Cu/Ag efflux protein CusF [Variovorax boronicumulans]
MSSALSRTIVAMMSTVVMSGAAAQASEPTPVFTRARLTSSYEEPGGKLYVRLKLLPRSKIPFATQTFRLPDRSLLADIPDGSLVKFTSKHIDGENTLTSIHTVAECKRFQPCE